MYGLHFPYYDILEEIYAKDMETNDMSKSFVGAIYKMEAEISKNTWLIKSDEEEDADS